MAPVVDGGKVERERGVMAASLATAFFPRAKVCPLTSFFNLTMFRCQVLPSAPQRMVSTAAPTLPSLPLEALEAFGRLRCQVFHQMRRSAG